MKTRPQTLYLIVALLVGTFSVASLARASTLQHGYKTYTNSRFAYSISYPAALLIAQGEADNGDGQKFLSRDGEAVMIVYGSHNALEQSLGELFSKEIGSGGDESGKPIITYRVLKRDWFVVSGRRGERVFYQKTMYKRGVLKTMRIEYPRSQANVYDEVTKEVVKSFRG